MKHLHLFNTETEYNEYLDKHYNTPTVSYIRGTDDVKYNMSKEEAYNYFKSKPLTFEVLSDGVIKWTAANGSYTRTIEYKKNDGEWTSITSTTAGKNINVVSGDIVQFRGDNATYSPGNESRYNSFSETTCQFNIKGNIMSLINSTGFVNLTTLESDYTFLYLFNSCTGLIDASNLLLPATTLADSCYESMFQYCTNLTAAPELPATTLADGCYVFMFWYCRNLTTAPELPATTLVDSCYNGMFRDCTSLITAPELSATTLASYCYHTMFFGCTNLNYIKCLATDISATDCTTN